jgi:hypothetical protein
MAANGIAGSVVGIGDTVEGVVMLACNVAVIVGLGTIWEFVGTLPSQAERNKWLMINMKIDLL